MGKINSKEKRAREEELYTWLFDIDKTLKKWIDSIPVEYSLKLDYSINSLIYLADYIISKYNEANEARDVKNSHEMSCVSGYIGEVYIRNIPGENSWQISEEQSKFNGKLFEFLFQVGEKGKRQIHPFNTYIPFIIHNKNNTKLFNSFRVIREKAFKEHGEIIDRIPGKGGYSYQYFILVKEESFQLQEIEQVLKNYYAKKGFGDKVNFHSVNHLLVDMGNDYYFHFQLDTSDSVQQESKEIAENYKGDKNKTVIVSCKSRIEFWGDEDPDGDYLNDHMFILEQILKNEKLLIYDYRNGVFFDEI